MQRKTGRELGARLASLVKASAGGWIPRKPHEPPQKPGWIPPKPHEPVQGTGWIPPKPHEPVRGGVQPAVTPPAAVQPGVPQGAPVAQPMVPKAASAAYTLGARLAQQQKQAALARYYARVLEKAASELDIDVDKLMAKAAAWNWGSAAGGGLAGAGTGAALGAGIGSVVPIFGTAAGGLIGGGLGGLAGLLAGGWGGGDNNDSDNAYVKNIDQMAAAHRRAMAAGVPMLSPYYQMGYGRGGAGAGGGSFGGNTAGPAAPGGQRGLWNRDEQRYAARMGINPQEYQSQEKLLQDMMAGSALRGRLARSAREYGNSPMW